MDGIRNDCGSGKHKSNEGAQEKKKKMIWYETQIITKFSVNLSCTLFSLLTLMQNDQTQGIDSELSPTLQFFLVFIYFVLCHFGVYFDQKQTCLKNF